MYDVHGNVRALEAVLAEALGELPDLIVVGGDVASGPWPRETIDALRALPGKVLCLRGNADRELLERAARPGAAESADIWDVRDEWTAAHLSDDDLSFLRSFSATETVAVAGLGDVLFCHATPHSDDAILTPLSSPERARRFLADTPEPVIVCGHTHVQFDATLADKRVVNAGSVGMPYEGRTGAFWALIGPDVSFRHTKYDVAAAAEEIVRSAYPGAKEFAEEYVLESYPRDDTMQTFERRARDRDAT